MAINALIAQGIRPIGADVPEIASMLQQKRQQEFQNSLNTAQNDRAQKTFDENLRIQSKGESEAKKKQDAERAVAGAQQLERLPDDQLAPFIRQSLPELAKAAHESGIRADDPAAIRKLASVVKANAMAYLGQGPALPKVGEISAGGSLYTQDPETGKVTMGPTAPANPGAGDNVLVNVVDKASPNGYRTIRRSDFTDGMQEYQKPTAASSGSGPSASLDPDTLRDAAIDVLSDPNRIRQYASYGASGQAIRTQINTAKAKLLRDIGLTEEQVIRQQAIAKGQVKSVSDLVGMQNAVNAYETVATGNGQRVLELIKKVNTSGVPAINSTIRLGKQATGNPDAAELMQVLQNYQTEVARIIANPRLVGQLTDTARKEIMDAVPANMTPAQAERIIKRLDFEFTLRNKGISDAIAQAQGQMVPGFPGGGSPAAPTAAPATRPPLSSFQK